MRDLKEITSDQFGEDLTFICCSSKNEAVEFIEFVYAKGYSWITPPRDETMWSHNRDSIYYCLTTDNTIYYSPERPTLGEKNISFSEFKTEFIGTVKMFQPVDDSVLYD